MCNVQEALTAMGLRMGLRSGTLSIKAIHDGTENEDGSSRVTRYAIVAPDHDGQPLIVGLMAPPQDQDWLVSLLPVDPRPEAFQQQRGEHGLWRLVDPENLHPTHERRLATDAPAPEPATNESVESWLRSVLEPHEDSSQ